MKLFEISNYLDTRVPLAFQEDYDNSGLLIGNKEQQIRSVLICLDCTEEVIDEAIKNNDNLIISHHPVIFSPIKKMTGSNYIEKIIQKAIKYDIAIYTMHTNLDNIAGGVSFQLAKKISLDNTKILKPKKGLLSSLSVYCPRDYTEKVQNALFNSGAGKIGGLYDRCSFISNGIGTFRPLKGAIPFSGNIGKDSHDEEDKIEVVFYSYLKSKILSALRLAHPYQEVAYLCNDINNDSQVGSGVIGDLKKTMTLSQFLEYIKKRIPCNVIRYNKTDQKKNIRKVAICGGSGRFLLEDAINNAADVFITADFKYHDFFDTNNQIIVFDIGHYESEFFTQELIYVILKENFSKLAVRLTSICTNPISYY